MKIEEVETNDIKIKKTKQTIDDVLDVPPPFMPKCSVMVISGFMGSGKSSFLNSIMTGTGKAKVYRNVFDKVHYITPKEVMESEENHPFKDHPPQRVYNDLEPETMDKIIKDAIDVKEEGGNSAIIIDDMSEYLKDKTVEQRLKKLIYKHRHYKTQIIITMLNLKSLPKQLRNLIDCYIVFRPKSNIEIQSLNDDVFNLGKDDLKQLLDYVFDEPYNFMFYNQRTHTFYKGSGKGGITKLKLSDDDN
jgi:KaiC/GvpD/RAD55 family RecA-like ATPase